MNKIAAKTMPANPLEVLCIHAAKTLPDSINERKSVLRAMEKTLQAKSPLYRDVQAQLAAVAVVEKLNAQLKMHFSGASQ